MDFMTTAEAAKYLEVSQKFVSSLIARGLLPGSTKEKFGPGTRYLIPRAEVVRRKQQKKAGKLSPGGRPAHKSAAKKIPGK